jgi:hypothetical protein
MEQKRNKYSYRRNDMLGAGDRFLTSSHARDIYYS